MICGVITVYQTNNLMLTNANLVNVNMIMLAIIIQMLEMPIIVLLNALLTPHSNRERLEFSSWFADWVNQ